ncbi:MAG TPA: PTS sugar transporter subunit IIA [Chlamydiales bacterium]|nr:PTS sugar transporter subunit IIA [Chlamydiales bacterium]
MDLKIKDVSDLLNVSEASIRRWLADGKIPAYKLNGQIRFSRIEIENWVLKCRVNQQNFGSFPFAEEKVSLKAKDTHSLVGSKMGTQAYSLYRAMNYGNVLVNVEGDTKEEVICNAVAQIAKDLNLDASVLADLLLDREKLMSTGLNHGVAVPHTRDFVLQKDFDVVTVVYPKKPIEYGSLDGEKVHTLFFLFACTDKRHLHLLAKLAHLSKDWENLEFFQNRPSKQDVLSYVKKWESKIPTQY